MPDIKLHLINYDRLGENQTIETRVVRVAELPGQGHDLLVSDNAGTKPHAVTNTYIPIGLGELSRKS